MTPSRRRWPRWLSRTWLPRPSRTWLPRPTRPEPEAELGFDVHGLPAGLRGALEAILMVVDEPVNEVSLAAALEVTVDEVSTTIGELAADYDRAERGFVLRQIAGGWRVCGYRRISFIKKFRTLRQNKNN